MLRINRIKLWLVWFIYSVNSCWWELRCELEHFNMHEQGKRTIKASNNTRDEACVHQKTVQWLVHCHLKILQIQGRISPSNPQVREHIRLSALKQIGHYPTPNQMPKNYPTNLLLQYLNLNKFINNSNKIINHKY